ncbi:unnamed protein product [Medioppia subpectinata]|uniref:Actin-related protein 3 n=1 Tax=Medioppia subpectinata TaxID=1979941 RepID=A0A7R9KE22_9ACAR|nr:unnamed protein product [Medioppia subpectinata]CAG2101835.1 unnamed protein product [Medioppia subpectinata]
MAGRLPAIVIDSGTGYTKLGYAGDHSPEFVIPSAVAIKEEPNVGDHTSRRLTIGVDVSIGEEALNQSAHTVKYPIQHGVVEDWDLMRMYWEECIYKYLKTKPEDHYFLVADPPLNTHENREYMAEMMFESFNVPGLCIAAQPVLALIASWAAQEVDERESTGIIIESGDCGTHCTPVVDNYYVINRCVQHIPIAGRHITLYVQNVLRERESAIPPTQLLATAEAIKEQFCYVCPDIDTEFERYYSNPNEWMKKYSATNAIKFVGQQSITIIGSQDWLDVCESNIVFIANIPIGYPKTDFVSHFETYGKVLSTKFVDRTGVSFAFIHFDSGPPRKYFGLYAKTLLAIGVTVVIIGGLVYYCTYGLRYALKSVRLPAQYNANKVRYVRVDDVIVNYVHIRGLYLEAYHNQQPEPLRQAQTYLIKEFYLNAFTITETGSE